MKPLLLISLALCLCGCDLKPAPEGYSVVGEYYNGYRVYYIWHNAQRFDQPYERRIDAVNHAWFVHGHGDHHEMNGTYICTREPHVTKTNGGWIITFEE